MRTRATLPQSSAGQGPVAPLLRLAAARRMEPSATCVMNDRRARRFFVYRSWCWRGHNAADKKRGRKDAHENQDETIPRHPARPFAGAGGDSRDELDGIRC